MTSETQVNSGIRKCECGRETDQKVECLCCQRERQWRAAPVMLAALRSVVDADKNGTGLTVALDAAKAALKEAVGPSE